MSERAYLPGIDGLRALAVLFVVAFHTGVIDGGWIGVDVFFAISGFLITGLLIAERERTGTIALRAFWGRRIRRLVPGLFVLLALVVVLVRLDQVTVAARDVWGALTYSTNWVHIAGGDGYWDRFATPDPLRHLWSLAIEEQFYLVWPVVTWFVLRRRDSRSLGRIALGGAVLSAVVQVVGISAGLSIDRVYQGTDTRAVAFLLGAALATHGWPSARSRPGSRVLGASVVVGVALLVVAVWMPGDRDWVFIGPLVVVSVLGTVVVGIGASHPPRWLTTSALQAIGRWSYGIYLFHWPLAISERILRLPTATRFVTVTIVSTALAALSYHHIETPIRERRVRRVGVALLLGVGASFATVAVAIGGSPSPVIDTTVTLAPRDSGQPDGATRVMVFGDSIPAVAADELRAEAEVRDLDIDVYAEPGCVPSEDERDQYGQPECVGFLRDARQRAVDLDIDDVVIWFGGTGETFSLDDVVHRFCSPESGDATRERIRRLVEYFDGVVERVVLVEPVPRADLGLPDAAGTACEIVAYEDVATDLDATLVPLRDTVCPEYPDDCDRVHRYDGMHYDGDAARTVAAVVLDAIR